MISSLLCLNFMLIISHCMGLNPSITLSAGAVRKNQYLTKVLLGKERPLKGSPADKKSLPMSWKQAIDFLDTTLSTGFVPDMKTWTTVLRICQKNQEAPATLSVFNRMKIEGIQPDRFAYQVAISSCLHMENCADSAKEAISLLRECDKILPLNGFFEAKISVSIFSAAISVCERASQSRIAIALYDEMIERKHLPDLSTISSVLAACEMESNWTKLDEVVNEMKTIKLVPDLTLFHQLIRTSGKRNDLRAAFLYLQSAIKQGLKPSRGTYRELVEACYAVESHVPNKKYLEKAKLLLYIAYPSESNGRDNGPMATFLLDREIHTVRNGPGNIKIGPGNTYEYNTEKMMKTLYLKTAFRLHDHAALPESGTRISFDAAEKILSLHCEKQALAALLDNYRHSASNNDHDIEIKVNLCMCADCHQIFKYASEGYNKRIACEDTSRRHIFQNGSCSCLDNWAGKLREKSNSVDIKTFI